MPAEEEKTMTAAAKKPAARKTKRKKAAKKTTRKKTARKTTARKTTRKKTARKTARKKTARKTTRKKAAKKTARKKTARKARKKTARKTTRRKTAKKTARKKTARKKTARKKTARKSTRKKTARKSTRKKAARKPGRRKTARKKTARKSSKRAKKAGRSGGAGGVASVATSKRAAPSTKSKTPTPWGTGAPAYLPDGNPSLDLYYWPTPNGWKVTIFLEEAGLPYNIVPVNIGRGDQFKPEFLKISPNNRMPALVDHYGPGGEPISIFESGAILQYLGDKTGMFYPQDVRKRTMVDEWLFWQVGGLGPMCGQAHHFRNYAPEKIPYGIDRYTNEVNRLYGVMEGRLADMPFLAGDYSIADMAAYPWVVPYKNQGQDLDDFPHLRKWFDNMKTRPNVRKAIDAGLEMREQQQKMQDNATEEEKQAAFKMLFQQRSRA